MGVMGRRRAGARGYYIRLERPLLKSTQQRSAHAFSIESCDALEARKAGDSMRFFLVRHHAIMQEEACIRALRQELIDTGYQGMTSWKPCRETASKERRELQDKPASSSVSLITYAMLR